MIIHSTVYLKNHGEDKKSPDHARVVEVKTFLEPLMKTLPQKQDPIEAMRTALRDHYGDKFGEPSPQEWIYYMEWDPVEERWVKRCVWNTTFEMDFGNSDVVGVHISEGSEY